MKELPARYVERFVIFLRDENAAEVTELALVLGLIIAGSIAAMVLVGGKNANNYSKFNSNLP